MQNLVKNWEMEVFHKANFHEYRSMDPSKYTSSLNGSIIIVPQEFKINESSSQAFKSKVNHLYTKHNLNQT